MRSKAWRALTRAIDGCSRHRADHRKREWWLRLAMAPPLGKGATLPHGLAWCQSRCRPGTAQFLAVSPSVEIAICACSSSKVRRSAPSGGLGKHSFGRGSRLRHGDCIVNVLTVALANKLARIALAVLVQGRNYDLVS